MHAFGLCLEKIHTMMFGSRTLFFSCDEQCRDRRGNPLFDAYFDLKSITSIYDIFPPEERETIRLSLDRDGNYRARMELQGKEGPFQAQVIIETIENEEGKHYHLLLIEPEKPIDGTFQEELFFNATHDALTCLPNRFYFRKKLEEALRRSIRDKTEGALFFLDLDNFKSINDTLGHEAGDLVLKEAADRLRNLLRDTDIVARYGGDEFLLLIEPLKSKEGPMYLAKRIIEAFNEPFIIDGIPYHIGTSIGIALFPKDGTDPETLIKLADMSMYRAKKEGKHGFRFFSDQIDEVIKRHYLVERALRNALEEEAFYLLFQPQIDIIGGKVVALEALLRLDANSFGDISPAEFIPIAEESNLIIRIGRWVFDRCCQHLQRWEEEGALQDIILSINLSGKQLDDIEWYSFVEKTLARYNLSGRRIEFEINERTLTKVSSTGLETLMKLHRLGCRLSIDDFGKGHSSLVDLKRYDFKRLKIDREIVDNLSDHLCQDVVKASIAMAEALGLDAMAKGVEKDDQANLLKNLGCKTMQGFLYGPPLHQEEVLHRLSEED